jgi:putative transposase
VRSSASYKRGPFIIVYSPSGNKIACLSYNHCMTGYRRLYRPGGTFFFTVVTYNRSPILSSSRSRALLHAAWVDVKRRFPFNTIAICLLPDHIHCIWQLPDEDTNYSVRWSEIKKLFSREYIKETKIEKRPSNSRIKRREAGIWQRRFWEHAIRDELDLHQHIDYIHFNPVKHELVHHAAEWKWSSFHRYVSNGVYDPSWGQGVEESIRGMSVGE